MRRFLPHLVLTGAPIGLVCTTLGACAPISPPACAQAEVLTLVAERLQKAGRDQFIEAGSVSQGPGATPDRFRCAVRVGTRSYDTERFGPTPVVTIGIVQYTIEMRRNGIFLLPEVPASPPPIGYDAFPPGSHPKRS